MAQSPFSFHCMICFEKFDADSRYPVVLPCSHTYVCYVCATRLDRCMECRTSLFVPQPTPAVRSPGNFAAAGHRSAAGAPRGCPGGPTRASGTMSRATLYASRHPSAVSAPSAQQSAAPPRPPLKQRHPLPKNTVLLSLMEATEIAASTALFTGDDDESDVEDGIEEETIEFGTSIATGASGTYVVVAKDGLAIVQNPPIPPDLGAKTNSMDRHRGDRDDCYECPASGSEQSPPRFLRTCPSDSSNIRSPPNSPKCVSDEIAGNVDGVVSEYWRDSPSGTSRQFIKWDSVPPESDSSTVASTCQSLDNLRLDCGDRVQIVSMEDGWAKLSRGYGFVHCPMGTELVKVGGSLDKACQLEAMLHSLAIRWNELENEQNKVEQMAARLMKDFQVALSNDDDFTVVAGSTIASPQDKGKGCDEMVCIEEMSVEVAPTGVASVQGSPCPPPEAARQKMYDLDSISIGRTISTDIQEQNRSLTCFALRGLKFVTKGALRCQNPGGGGRMRLRASSSYPLSNTNDSSVSPSPSNHTAPPSLSGGEVEWRRSHGRKPTNGVDFRTGLSGHAGLTVPQTHPQDSLDRSANARMMSAHSGLTVPRLGRANRGSSGEQLNFPAFRAGQTT